MTCVVCGRAKSQHLKVSVVDVDGTRCVVCEECGGDQFRRVRAVEMTLGKPRSCDCGGLCEASRHEAKAS